jgi:hypothetical protein
MAPRRWTAAQKARQAELIQTWKPWEQSTGPVTPAGKTASSKNAFNRVLREVMRELTRSNRALLAYLHGTAAPPSYDRTTIDKLLDDVSKGTAKPTSTRRKLVAKHDVIVMPVPILPVLPHP